MSVQPAAPNAPTADHALGQRVLREHVASVYSTYGISTLTHMAFVVVFGSIIYSQLKDPSLLFWLAGLLMADIYVFFTPRWTPSRPVRESAYWARKISRVVTLVSMKTARRALIAGAVAVAGITGAQAALPIQHWTLANGAKIYLVATNALPIVDMLGGEVHKFVSPNVEQQLAAKVRSLGRE